jgi:hypothetical protein
VARSFAPRGGAECAVQREAEGAISARHMSTSDDECGRCLLAEEGELRLVGRREKDPQICMKEASLGRLVPRRLGSNNG